MKPFEQQNYYELLEVPPTATADEIRAAYERGLEVYGPDSPALYGLADPSQAEALRKRLLEAMEILTEEDLRDEYDKSIGLPPRAQPAKEPPLQLTMMEVLASAEATHSTLPSYQVSYIPHLPPPEYSAVVALEPAKPASSSGEPAPAESPPAATSVAAPPIANEGEAPRRMTPGRDTVRVAEPLPETPGESTSRYVESVDGVVRGPRPLDAAQEMAHEAAIANAESALAQVASRVRERDRHDARPKPLDITPESEFNGELLRQVRESKGLSLQMLAERTRIAQRHIENVEADRYDALPATVYLRGILMNMARELSLDALRVAKSYLNLVAGKGK
jgi:hypothetical protein